MRIKAILNVSGVIAAAFLISACRGTLSKKPPIHIVQNMDFQEMYEPQAGNAFFADGRAMRPPVAGTVARGMLEEDVEYYTGRTEIGTLVPRIVIPLSLDILKRGKERYDIFCSVCHGLSGDGQGIIMTGNYGFVPAPSYHTNFLREISDGYFFDVITNGVRTMPGYASQVPVRDRWAIVAYVRALQRSQQASISDVPTAER